MAPDIELRATDVALITTCDAHQEVRQFNNDLYVCGAQESEFLVPCMQYTPLNVALSEVRLLRLHPSDDISKHVRCDLEIHNEPLLPPFIAIKNARGYRNLEEAIEVRQLGIPHALVISSALERFLRYLRTRLHEPTYIWVRYACVLEYDHQEQHIYWTRTFSDRMYSNASQVLDMHDINNRLIENGYFEKVVSSCYVNSKKEWYGRTDKVVLPRVCPVRLGTQPDNDSPITKYEYMPLDMVADEIRIMCVMPAQDANAPIIIHVAHCPIRCEVNFIALSYRWGTDHATEQVVLNGQTKMIRKNLADTIRSLRMEYAILPLWVDALSINQNDTAERSRQVWRMGEIYHNAMSVYSWTGPKTYDTEIALDLMTELDKHPVVRFNDLGQFDLGIEPSRLVGLCAALYRFLTRPYFRRTWILQEIAMASNPIVITGCERAISFDTLDKAAYNLHDMLTRDPSLSARIEGTDSSITHLDIKALAHARKIFYFRYLVSNGLGGGSMLGLFYKIQASSPNFLDALILAREFDCTDPRDRIYGLWNVAQDKTGLNSTPGYNKPYPQVYTEFVQSWALQHQSLEIIGAVEATPKCSSFYEVAPSWCPDWNTQSTMSSLIRKDYLPARPMPAMQDQNGSLYAADGFADRDSLESRLFSFRGNALHCTGLILDRISFMLSDVPGTIADSRLKSTSRSQYWAERLQQLYKEDNVGAYDDPDRAIHAMIHGDSVKAWPSVAESGYRIEDCGIHERFVCLPAESRHVLPFAGSYDRTEALGVVDTVLSGRRPFVTDDGFMGLGPAYFDESRDGNRTSAQGTTGHLAVVAGCSVPLLLRDREDGTYELIGTCFVQGWMEGEWIHTIMGADDPVGFWNAVGDSAELIIS